MNPPSLERARDYALARLEQELAPELRYHSLAHTRDEVVPAAARLADLEGVEGEDLLLLLTAAVFHDIGFVEQRVGHEAASARIAAQILPRFGYTPAQISVIRDLILATELGRSPRTLLEKIMADADLDGLGRDDYMQRNQDLRAELEAFGLRLADEEWFNQQVQFLRWHRYHTGAARTLRQAGKQRNIQAVQVLLQEIRAMGAIPQPGASDR
jgi:uncharacterized protein